MANNKTRESSKWRWGVPSNAPKNCVPNTMLDATMASRSERTPLIARRQTATVTDAPRRRGQTVRRRRILFLFVLEKIHSHSFILFRRAPPDSLSLHLQMPMAMIRASFHLPYKTLIRRTVEDVVEESGRTVNHERSNMKRDSRMNAITRTRLTRFRGLVALERTKRMVFGSIEKIKEESSWLSLCGYSLVRQ